MRKHHFNMIDVKVLRESVSKKILAFSRRGYFFNHVYFYELDFKIRCLKKKMYRLNRIGNLISCLVKFYKSYNLDYYFLTSEIFNIRLIIIEIKIKLNYLELKFNSFLLSLPNYLHSSVENGLSADDNVEIRFFKSLKFCSNKKFSDNFLYNIESNKNFIDFDLSAQVSGSGFVFLKNEIATLYRALSNYMIDLHVQEHGYIEINPPLCVNERAMYNTGHFPKFYNDQFELLDSNLWLIPTAEVVLSNLFSNLTISDSLLPIKVVAKTPCFRKEKGSYGAKVKGLIRQHQFDKVELVNIVKCEKSYDALEELVYHAERVLQNLDLSYRVLTLCSFDTGFSASKTYDLEVWFPKRQRYIEVSSCSNTESFQAFRMAAKVQSACGARVAHILNGSGLAVGRILLAIIENYSDINGNIVIPNVLVKYMDGIRIINYL